MADIQSGNYGDVPANLRTLTIKGSRISVTVWTTSTLFKNDWVKQQYLPDKIKNAQYYEPKTNGKFETALAQQYERLRKAQHAKN